MSLAGLWNLVLWLFGGSKPPAPDAVEVAFRPTEKGMPGTLTGSFTVTPAAPSDGSIAHQLVTYAVNGQTGGVVDAMAGGTFTCNPGDTIVASAVNVSPGGVSSAATSEFKFTAIDNTTVPPAPSSLAIAFSPTPTPAPTPAPAPTPTPTAS